MISTPGASLSVGGPGASSALLAPPGSPPVPFLPQESSRLPLQSDYFFFSTTYFLLNIQNKKPVRHPADRHKLFD
ncbi:hypothetical protein A8F94_11190 [Bacillus sp. FJAT-27225]|nr:hypothetical protein A8F94_11190 [Bacillus sp. FJAT-27225]